MKINDSLRRTKSIKAINFFIGNIARFVLLTLFFLFNIFTKEALSQINNYGSISVQNPNISSFNKYIDAQPADFNGGVNISIPIYNIEVGDYSVPIVLRYNTTGVRVNEEASMVGLGWNLNVGGNINQNVIGAIDKKIDYHDIIQFNNHLIANNRKPVYPMLPGDLKYESWIIDNPIDLYPEHIVEHFFGAHNLEKCYPIAYEKGMPDAFYYSFLNYQGKFFIDYRNDSVYIVDRKEKIYFSQLKDINGNDKGWKAVTPDGTWFYFTELDHITVVGGQISTSVSARNFNLTKIVFPNGKELNFEYSFEGFVRSGTTVHETRSYDIKGFRKRAYCAPAWCIVEPYPLTTPTYYYDSEYKENIYELKVLKRIFSADNNVSIDFHYSNREDIPYNSHTGYHFNTAEKKLDSIVVSNKVDDLKKTYQFNYDYFTAEIVNQNNVWADGNSDDKRKRLKLTSFGQKGDAFYHFGYSNIELPSKQSYSQDYWGYYNGKTTNTSLLPNLWSMYHLQPPPSAEIVPWDIISYGSNRKCDTNFVTAGTLNMIKYPAGGRTIINYESNSFNNYYYPCEAQDNEYAQIVSSQTTVLNNAAYRHVYGDTGTSNYRAYFFDLDKPSKVKVDYTFNWTYQNTTFEDIAGAYIKLATRDVVYNIPIETKKVVEVSYNDSRLVQGSFELELEPGNYGLYPHSPILTAIGKQTTVSANIFIQPLILELPEGYGSISYGGGLRIKSIMQLDNNLDSVLATSYNYVNGLLMSPLNYIYETYQKYIINETGCGASSCNDIPVSSNSHYSTKNSSSIVQLSLSAKGGNVGYEKIIKHNCISKNAFDTLQDGFIEKDFYAIVPLTSIGVPEIPFLLNGKIKIESVFNSKKELINKKEYFYHEIKNHQFYGITNSLNRLCGYFMIYPIASKSIFLEKVVEQNFLKNNAFGVAEKMFEYNQDNMVKRVFETFADGNEAVTSNTYICDIENPTGIYYEMQEHNFLSALKSKTVTFNETKVSEEVFEYESNENFIVDVDNKLFKVFNPSEVKISPTGNNVEYNININYDNKSNIVEVQKNDEKGSYLWGYNQSFLIAKIANSAQNNVLHVNFEDAKPISGGSFSNDDWESTHCSIKENVSYTGKKCFAFQGSSLRTKNTLPAGKYRIRMWTKMETGTSGTITLTGVPGVTWTANNNWQMQEKIITITASSKLTFNPTGSILVDDLSIIPYDAQIETFTWHPLYGMTSKTDNNGNTLFFSYDGLGRLIMVKDQDGNIRETHKYNIAQ